MRPERREQIEQIEQEFTAAVESLKRSKLGKGRLGQSALYALPWYVIMGPPAAGKTTAITASGLDFPLGTNRIRGIGGTRNCDWFFSTSAICASRKDRASRPLHPRRPPRRQPRTRRICAPQKRRLSQSLSRTVVSSQS